MYTCSKGHQSTESDYCSECGTKITGMASGVSVQDFVSDLSGMICPDCSTPHEPNSGNFCEICGYNFSTGSSGEVPILSTPKTEEESTKKQEINNIKTWEIVITIDPEKHYPESPEPPNQAPIILPLEKSVNLIGRNSKARAVFPEIALDFDDAISHRHAILNQNENGTFSLRDIGSANGTTINGIELKPMVDIPLKDGDEFTLGHWTRIKIIHN